MRTEGLRRQPRSDHQSTCTGLAMVARLELDHGLEPERLSLRPDVGLGRATVMKFVTSSPLPRSELFSKIPG